MEHTTGELRCDYTTPEYDGENATRDYFPEGFVNAQNRNLYTQLFLVLHWDSQTNHGTRVMTDLEFTRDLDEVDVRSHRSSRNIKPRGLATFEEYCRLIVWLGQNGTKFASRENEREKKGEVVLCVLARRRPWCIGKERTYPRNTPLPSPDSRPVLLRTEFVRLRMWLPNEVLR